jgi:nonribosomal peptide synthetase DhbF
MSDAALSSVNIMPFDYDLRFDGHPATAHNLTNRPVEDMSIVLYDRSDSRELRIDFNGNPGIYSADHLASLQQRFLKLLAALADPDQRIGSLDILAPEERRTILQEWNDTSRAIPSATLPDLFAAQVAKTPDATAVVYEDQSLSYGELDARSSQLAHHLRDLGVGPDVVVGICVERSLEMLVGLDCRSVGLEDRQLHRGRGRLGRGGRCQGRRECERGDEKGERSERRTGHRAVVQRGLRGGSAADGQRPC